MLKPHPTRARSISASHWILTLASVLTPLCSTCNICISQGGKKRRQGVFWTYLMFLCSYSHLPVNHQTQIQSSSHSVVQFFFTLRWHSAVYLCWTLSSVSCESAVTAANVSVLTAEVRCCRLLPAGVEFKPYRSYCKVDVHHSCFTQTWGRFFSGCGLNV